jgi:hypothetical protein
VCPLRAPPRNKSEAVFPKNASQFAWPVWPWITGPPADMPQAAILKRAQAIRQARGAAFIEDRDIRQAIAELSR